MRQHERALYLMTHLRGPRPVPARTLAERLGVSIRTVYRDVTALVAVGVPLVSLPGQGYVIEETYFMAPPRLTAEEAVAVKTATALLANLLPAVSEAADRARTKVAAAGRAPETAPADMAAPPTGVSPHLSAVFTALTTHRALAITYYALGRDQLTERVVEPWALQYYSRDWHVVGRCRTRGAARDFALRRIRAAKVLDEPIVPPDGFDPAVRLPSRPGPLSATVVVDASAYHRALEHLPAGVVEEGPTDGDRRFRFRFQTDPGRLIPWVLSLGEAAEVTDPPELRRQIADTVKATVTRYRTLPD